MKTLLDALVTFLVMGLASPGGAQAPIPGRPMMTQAGSLSAAPSISGMVKQYLLTPVGGVEGVELQDGTDIRLPPHMGATLAAIVKPGDQVNAIGFTGPQVPYGRVMRALTITNAQTNRTVIDQPPTAPPPPAWTRSADMKPMTLTGRLDHYILNDRGDIDGLILSNGDEVKFPPHIGAVVAMISMQQPSETIEASGYGTTSAFGTVVDVMSGSLTVGGQPIPLTGSAAPRPPL